MHLEQAGIRVALQLADEVLVLGETRELRDRSDHGITSTELLDRGADPREAQELGVGDPQEAVLKVFGRLALGRREVSSDGRRQLLFRTVEFLDLLKGCCAHIVSSMIAAMSSYKAGVLGRSLRLREPKTRKKATRTCRVALVAASLGEMQA